MSTPGAGGKPSSCCWNTSSPPDPVPACPALPFRYLALYFASPVPFVASAAPLRFPRESGGPGTAVWPLSRNEPQRSGCSAGTMYRLSLLSFPLRKQGPRNRSGAAVTERTSAQRTFRQHDARVLLKTSTLRAAEAVVVRCPLGCHPELGGPWVLGPGYSAGAGKRGVGKRGPRNRGGAVATKRTSAQRAFRQHDARVPAPFVSPAKAGAQEPRWGRCQGADLSAVGVPPARCAGS